MCKANAPIMPTPVFEQGRLDAAQLLKEEGGPHLSPLEALELPHCPSHERQIDVSKHGRMVSSAERLNRNNSLFRELLTFRGRNWYPRKSNVTFGYLPLRLPSLQ
jgi:hypothetical protein